MQEGRTQEENGIAGSRGDSRLRGNDKGEFDARRGMEKGGGMVTAAEGAGLRELHSLLLELDPRKTWGGLRRVHTPMGDYLWLCPEHYEVYEPGPPKLD